MPMRALKAFRSRPPCVSATPLSTRMPSEQIRRHGTKSRGALVSPHEPFATTPVVNVVLAHFVFSS